MAHAMTLKGGENTTVFTAKDFEFLVEKYMGYEAAEYVRSLRTGLAVTMNDIIQITNDPDVVALAKEYINGIE